MKTEEDIIEKLNQLDDQTLNYIQQYANEKRKLAKTSTLISSAIATIAGFALFSGFIFKEENTILIAVLSTFFGAVIAYVGLKERKKEEMELLRKIFEEGAKHGKISIKSNINRDKIIKNIVDMEGL